MLNRRRLLALGAATAGGAAVLPFTRIASSSASTPPSALAGHAGHGDHLFTGPRPAAAHLALTPFSERMPVPPVLAPTSTAGGVDVYTLPIQGALVDILPGLKTPAITFGGSFIGPTIRAKTGRPVKVTFSNTLPMVANVHLHGGHVPQISDGHPMDPIAPGASRTYDYPNLQRGATLWYHDHSHGTEADHVYRGMHGFYLIQDPAERHLKLPSGNYDVPIMLRNAEFDAAGAFVFGHPDNRTTILANGKSQPYFPVVPRKYRFRLANTALKHVFRLNMGGQPITKIASDGGLLPTPMNLEELVLSSGERVEIVVDFAQHVGKGPLYLYDGDTPILRFDVMQTLRVHDDSCLPSKLRPLPALGTPTVFRKVTMGFDMTARPPIGQVDGHAYDPTRVEQTVKRGATEVWEVVNVDDDPFAFDHPFHMHLMQFRVIGRNGGAPAPEDAGLKDTVYITPKGSVKIQVTFNTPYTGRYVYHCHYLEHSALGMMATMEIVP